MARERRTSTGFYYWSPTSLGMFLDCPRQWYFSRKYKLTSGRYALGTFMHRRVADIRLAAVKKRRFKSAKTWANSCTGMWTRFYCQQDEVVKIRGQVIVWKDDNEKWIYREKVIKEICLANFDRLMAEPSPIVFYDNRDKPHTEYSFSFEINGLGFSGEIDEILPGMRIRDYKTGKWGYLEWQFASALQPTFYGLGFCLEAARKERFRQLVGVDVKLARQWAGKPVFISPDVKFHYYMLQKDGRKSDEEQPTSPLLPNPGDEEGCKKISRSDIDFKKLCQQIEEANYRRLMMEELNAYPVGKNPPCWWCLYKDRCNEMSEQFFDQEIQLRVFERKREVKMVISDYEQLMLPFARKKVKR